MSTERPPEEVAARIPGLTDEERQKAAVAIQKTYRGHRTRRALKGHTLDPTTRWAETIRQAQYRQLTTPHGPGDTTTNPRTVDPDTGRLSPARVHEHPDQSSSPQDQPSPARRQWQRVGQIALHAGADDSPPVSSDEDSDSEELDGTSKMSPNGRRLSLAKEDKMARRQRRAQARNDRKKTAKMMDLQYFLEMVDQKHRYGSNLRAYHNVWKSKPTTQNFFYWLDYGDGKDVELAQCSRERLEREQVRYLSREERSHYLVKVDKEGRLVWAKNGERITTSDEEYRDSIHGIVHRDSKEPRFRDVNNPTDADYEKSSSDSSSDDEDNDDDDDELSEAERYANEGLKQAKGPSKLAHVSPAVIFNHLLRASIKRGNKWIFVADTSFRLYVGIKESGAFQHSSFLHGARISAAGLIKIKDGQLRSLSPLSGHYRPPAANFRAFVHSLRDEGVDMSRVSISKSYAVLVGIEGYTKTRKKLKKAENDVKHTAEKIVKPEKAKEEEEKNRDKSKSAEKERRFLEKQRAEAEAQKKSLGLTARLLRKFGLKDRGTDIFTNGTTGADDVAKDSPGKVAGTGPEEGIPPPDGKR